MTKRNNRRRVVCVSGGLSPQCGVDNMNLVSRFAKCESGATAIEYGLIASLIGVAVIASVKATGTNLSATFVKIKDNMS